MVGTKVEREKFVQAENIIVGIKVLQVTYAVVGCMMGFIKVQLDNFVLAVCLYRPKDAP